MNSKVYSKLGANGIVKYKRLYDLGEDRLRQLEAELYKGMPTFDAAKLIQDKWGLYNDIKTETLSKQIQRYKRNVLNKTLVSNVQNPDGTNSGKEITRVVPIDGEIHAHTTLEKLCLMQQERLNKIYLQEQKLPSVMDTVRREIETFSRLLGQLSTLQMDLGILQRVPKKVLGEMTYVPQDGVDHNAIIKQAMIESSEENAATHKVFSIIDRMSKDGVILDADFTEE